MVEGYLGRNESAAPTASTTATGQWINNGNFMTLGEGSRSQRRAAGGRGDVHHPAAAPCGAPIHGLETFDVLRGGVLLPALPTALRWLPDACPPASGA